MVEPSTSTLAMAAVPKSAPRKVNIQFFLPAPLWVIFHFMLCCSLIAMSYSGAVCVRVPSSLKAGVELCGASVDISPEVVLHRAENNAAEGQATVTG